ncbi:rho GTPase-activating protein 12-like isoform X2 [Clavelina lepadiformis]|uniref:rho GTPase-activating protein 12-like isoform X2 n=1 Tax=Clavelina lepadiformis TaxID=159417 RepID=UPI0040420DC4
MNAADLGRVLHVEYDYKYKANDGRIISIEDGEEFILIKKSNADWWQVIKEGEKKPFYIPAAYVRELEIKRFPNHPYFKKAHNTLLKNKRKQRQSLEQLKQEDGSAGNMSENSKSGMERMIVLTGSRDDLTVLSSVNYDKFSEMHASCDSLDQFIENENPYDEVPFETSFSPRIHQVATKNSAPTSPQFEEPEYANLETIQKSMSPQSRRSVATKSESECSVAPPMSHYDKPNVHPVPHDTRISVYANPGGDAIGLGLPSEPPHNTVTVEILDDGWELQLDNQTGSKYYLNSNTGEMRVKPLRKKAPEQPHVSARKVVPPAVPEASKKPTLNQSRKSTENSESTQPVKRSLNTPLKPPSDMNENPKSPDESMESSHDSATKTNKNNNNSHFSILSHGSPEMGRKKHTSKHKKTNSDIAQQPHMGQIPSPKERHKLRSSSFTANHTKPHILPIGWFTERSPDGDVVFIKESNGDRWHQMTDEQSGNCYYFNEVTRQTSWQLPQFDLHDDGDRLIEELHSSEESGNDGAGYLSKSLSEKDFKSRKANTLERDFGLHTNLAISDDFAHNSSSLPPNVPAVKPRSGRTFARQVDRVMQARSMIILSDSRSNIQAEESQQHYLHHAQEDVSSLPPPHPMIERQGRLYWTKLMEAGKKQRKNWIQQWVVLLANNLLFYKDQKQATMTRSLPHGRPDSSCDLRGAVISWAKDKSSKKNLQTLRGLSLLLHHDDLKTIQKWLTAIKATIQKANLADPLDPDIYNPRLWDGTEEDDVDLKKKKDKKKKQKPPTRHGSDAKNSDKVRSKLKKFINRRPTFESLQERGIIKESVFGCRLDKLCEKENTTVPSFIKLCVEEVERRGLDIDGIYRVSGNLSHIQKLRFMIDRDEAVDLSEPQWEDIHLITGALKMFLRELPEPVIPFNFFDKFVAACKIQDQFQRVDTMKKLVSVLPKPNGDTLRYLMKHFCRVVEHSAKNRMQVQNIAIVFGPTLLLKPTDDSRLDPAGGGHMAVYMVYQNQIIDYMLTEYNEIFSNY